MVATLTLYLIYGPACLVHIRIQIWTYLKTNGKHIFFSPVHTCEPQVNQTVCKQFALGAQLINFLRTWGEQRTPGASNSLCVRSKNRQILVHSERYANCSRMVQHRFTVSSTHTRIWFTNRSRAVSEPFDALVCMRLLKYQLETDKCLFYLGLFGEWMYTVCLTFVTHPHLFACNAHLASFGA